MIRVVIADDHTLVRHGLRALLATLPDVDVVGEATSGAAAVALVKAHEPDVALIDVSMPGMSGVDVTAEVAKSNPATAVLILSMYGDPAIVAEALAAGARGYLLKESGSDELVAAIRSVAAGAKRVLGAGIAAESAQQERDQLETLTQREREILTLIASGLTNKEAGHRLGISTRTVEAHRARILQKLRLHSAAELTLYAARRGLLLR